MTMLVPGNAILFNFQANGWKPGAWHVRHEPFYGRSGSSTYSITICLSQSLLDQGLYVYRPAWGYPLETHSLYNTSDAPYTQSLVVVSNSTIKQTLTEWWLLNRLSHLSLSRGWFHECWEYFLYWFRKRFRVLLATPQRSYGIGIRECLYLSVTINTKYGALPSTFISSERKTTHTSYKLYPVGEITKLWLTLHFTVCHGATDRNSQ